MFCRKFLLFRGIDVMKSLTKAILLSVSIVSLAFGSAQAGVTGCENFQGIDFNDDGLGDIVAQNPSTARFTTMSGLSVLGAQGFTDNGGGAFEIKAVGDLNNDGQDDVIMQGKSGSAAAGVIKILLMTGVTASAPGWMSDGGGIWDLKGAADMNGDGNADLVFEGSGAALGFVKIQLMNGTTLGAAGFVPNAGGIFSLVGLADTNGDNRTDLIFDGGAAAGTAKVAVTDVGGLTATTQGFIPNGGGSFTFISSGDLDNDGDEDLAWNSGIISRFDLMDGTAIVSSPSTAYGAFTLMGLADLNGDCNADGVYVGADNVRLELMTTGVPDSNTLLALGDDTLLGLGDLNGDGDADLIFRNGAENTLRLDIVEGGVVTSTGTIPTNISFEVLFF